MMMMKLKQRHSAKNYSNKYKKMEDTKMDSNDCYRKKDTHCQIINENIQSWWDIALVSCLVLGIYAYTLFPSIAGGDSGELVAESCHLGVSHPPGYPLYNILIYLVTRISIPLKTPAWNANLFSAVCGTGSSVLIYLSVLLWTKRNNYYSRISAFTAACLFAFSPLIWTYAISAEVFALNNLFAASLVYVLLLYSRYKEWKYAYWGAFLSGLAMCNQHTIILYEIPIIVWVMWTLRQHISIKICIHFGLLFLLGLLPYAYMPLTSWLNPQDGSWGHVTTFSGFIHHFRRGDYGTFRLFSSDKETEGLATRLYEYSKDFTLQEGLYISTPLALLGLILSLKSSFWTGNLTLKSKTGIVQPGQNPLMTIQTSSAGVAILIVYLFYMIVFHSLSNLPLSQALLYGIHMRFWQQPNIIVFIWTGIGLSVIMRLFSKRFTSFIGKYAVVFSCLSLIGLQIYKWKKLCDQRDNWHIQNYAKALIDPLPKNALYLTNYDHQWTSIRYLQRCEGYRKDITFINLSMMTYKWFEHKHKLYPHLIFPGSHLVRAGVHNGGFSIKEFVDANYDRLHKSGIFIGGKLSYDDPDFRSSYTWVPLGLLDKFVKNKKVPSLDEWYDVNEAANKIVNTHLHVLPPEDIYDDTTWEWTIGRDYHMKFLYQAYFLLDRTIAKNNSLALLVKSTKSMEYSLLNEPSSFYDNNIYKNLGLAYANMVKTNEEFKANSEPFDDHIGNPKDSYKDRAKQRMLEVWSKWVKIPSSKSDNGYATIKNIVDRFG